MKTNKDYILRVIAGEGLLVPTGKASENFNGMINLSETAAFIWRQVDTAATLEEIADRLMAEYEVDRETALRDTYGFARSLYVRGLILEVPELAGITDRKQLAESD